MSAFVSPPLHSKKILLAVGGGIAAYKSVELLRLLVKSKASVRVAMTRRAKAFVGELTFQTLSGDSVLSDLFSLTQESEIGHIQAADSAELIIVAPATANILAKLAHGIADDAVTATILASKAPVLLAPSMNVNMWENSITQDNVRKLQEHGKMLVGPGNGFLACQWVGPGRMAEPAQIVSAAAHIVSAKTMRGTRVLITAGPTREAIDPVRYLSNHSTGKMGTALAAAMFRHGADVTLVHGPMETALPLGPKTEAVTTAQQMADAVLSTANSYDLIVMAAAVADFKPVESAPQKIKRGDLQTLQLSLGANPDILRTLAKQRGNAKKPILVGFAAETNNVLQNAEAKFSSKGCDMLIANDVSDEQTGFGSDQNRVWLITKGGRVEIPLARKEIIAEQLIPHLVGLLG